MLISIVVMGLLPAGAATASSADHVRLVCDKKAAARERAFFGVQLGPAEEGIEILEVIGDSPADKAGFRSGDVVMRFGGEDVDGVEGFVEQVRSRSSGDDVQVEFERDGKTQTRTVTLAGRADEVTAFAFGGHGPCMMGLPAELREKLSGLAGEDVRVEMECEDGKGQLTIEQDGDVETHEFDCSAQSGTMQLLPGGSGGKFFAFTPEAMGLDEEGMEKLHEEIEQRMREGGLRWEQRAGRIPNMKFLHNDELAVRFREDKNGRIEAVIRKGDSELVREFDDAADLEKRAPELYEKYLDLSK